MAFSFEKREFLSEEASSYPQHGGHLSVRVKLLEEISRLVLPPQECCLQIVGRNA